MKLRWNTVPVVAKLRVDDGHNGLVRLEWNVRHRPLSFSHQESTSECVKNHRQLRHSYSQREVSRHTRQASVESLASSTTDLKKSHAASVESVGVWSGNNPTVTKSTPHLVQGRNQRHSASSGGLHQSDTDEARINMVMRRFKKGSVYDALASTSGLDFSPVVQLKTYNSRRDDSSPLMLPPQTSENLREKPAKLQHDKCPVKDSSVTNASKNDSQISSLNSNPSQTIQETKRTSPVAKDDKESAKCLAAHEKYPSWPVVDPESTSVTYRSHSWTGQTDYPKEKPGFYSRPKKVHQYKITTNQLQPVLERAPDSASNKTSPDLYSSDRNHSYRPPQYLSCNNSAVECNGKQQFDFEAFHTPCIPQCFEDKDYRIHSPPERDSCSISPSKIPSEAPTSDSGSTFLSGHEEIRHQAQYSVPLSTIGKQRPLESKSGSSGPATPFLDRLRLENALQIPPPPPVPMHPVAVPQLQHQELQEQRNDFELSSENGTWMGSMESSSHGRGMPKWQGSYSDLSTLSTQLSNRSSLFDSGHSTMPESGRLSPESSCDSTAPSLLLEGPTRAEVVARHGCHREIVAHSARVQQPERHGSESILYYATGSSIRPSNDTKSPSKSPDGGACSSRMSAEESLYRSHASLTLSQSLSKSNLSDRESKPNKCLPSRQDSRKSSNSYSSDDSFSRPRCPLSDDTSGSSSDVSNITCISNFKGSAKSPNLDKTSPVREMAPKPLDQGMSKYRTGIEPPKSKSMDETTRKFIFPAVDKRQRVSDPELKAIQKQAVMSFYQRMSLAESIKSDPKPLVHSPGADTEPPPPYEASPSNRMKMPPPKLSLPSKNIKQQMPSRSSFQSVGKPEMPLPSSESGLQNYHSRSVPNLVMLKGQSLDLPASHPIFKQTYNGSESGNQYDRIQKKQGSPLMTEEVLSWDQLPNVLEKKKEASEKKGAPSSESKDPPEDNGGCSSGMHYLKPHKSPRKVQLKEVHHSNETASVRVMTPDGVTLVQTNERKEEKSAAKGPHKRRPAPPPPPKQPPRRPPPPPPPVTPPPSEVVVIVDKAEETQEKLHDLKIDVQRELLSSPQGSCCGDTECPASPDLPLPPPPSAEGNEIMNICDEPLPPPPDPRDVDIHPRMLDSTSLIYPKNSYMSYRSERKIGRQGFDGKYRRSFHTSTSSMDLTTCDSSFQDGKNVFSPSSWEQIHNIRQHGTTVIFHSDCLQPVNRLQRSSSQDCVLVEEATNNGSDHISNILSGQNSENQSSNSIQCPETQDHQQQSVPCQPTSQERVTFEVQNSSSDSRQNSLHTKGMSLKSAITDVILNCETSDSHCSSSLDNGRETLTDDNLISTEIDPNVDLNQNSVKNNKSDRANSKSFNGTDINNRINSATQTTDTPRLHRKYCKTKAELECEQLSLDFIHHYGDVTLKNLLVPAPNHKTMSDYIEGLLNLELEKNGLQSRNSFSSSKNQNDHREEKWASGSEKFDGKMSDCKEVNDNQNVDNDLELKKKKDELIISIGKKVESLKDEQKNIRAEMIQNELLGKEIANQLQALAKPNEMEKYLLHVEEMEKIVNLLLSLSGRLARAENILKNMQDSNSEERKLLEAKRDKLKEQHEDACRLKESIDKRSNQVSTFLHKYFSDSEFANYDRFIKMRTKLIVDIREIDEKINLGEEQLAALSVVAHLWKSANS
ncbi:Protein Shroom3 [Araneus ventricosus]|uniref:Protein Shroom3 n=1 Tax=Araneus ventricosus TaxID=182803 RepID=A0A4Y2CVA6_ARAVE|nr:Protein Shroom3 [Araneus ventricosus]